MGVDFSTAKGIDKSKVVDALNKAALLGSQIGKPPPQTLEQATKRYAELDLQAQKAVFGNKTYVDYITYVRGEIAKYSVVIGPEDSHDDEFAHMQQHLPDNYEYLPLSLFNQLNLVLAENYKNIKKKYNDILAYGKRMQPLEDAGNKIIEGGENIIEGVGNAFDVMGFIGKYGIYIAGGAGLLFVYSALKK